MEVISILFEPHKESTWLYKNRSFNKYKCIVTHPINPVLIKLGRMITVSVRVACGTS